MIRRAFLKMVSAASVAFAVGVEHFHPIGGGWAVELEGRDLDVDVENQWYSTTLQALRQWNDARVEGLRAGLPLGTYWDNEFDRALSETKFKVASNKIRGGSITWWEAENVKEV